MDNQDRIRWFETLTSDDVALVGGKNASLGEMIRALKEEGVRVPDGFATTAQAYRQFLAANDLSDKIRQQLDAWHGGERSLQEAGKAIRRLIRQGDFPQSMADAIGEAYQELSQRFNVDELDVAVRSSATAEDLPEASFAGQQETFLNLAGEEELLDACRKCYASLFTDRAISYREEQGFDHMDVALSVGVQKMVRSDRASSGVMFTIDTETGFPDVGVINAAWGLGETVVQGSVNPDEYRVFKPLLDHNGTGDSSHQLKPIIEKALGAKERKLVYASGASETTKEVETSTSERRSFTLTDEEILQLAGWGAANERHRAMPMDIEWAKDGQSDERYIVQARPETVQSQKEAAFLKTYTLKETGKTLVSGLAIGEAIASGKANVIKSAEHIDQFEDDAILVTGMTDPDWVPIMKRARGIVTDHGGRTSHAAIISRELGIPAAVGTGNATAGARKRPDREPGQRRPDQTARGRGGSQRRKLIMKLRTIKDAEVRQRRVLVRVDFNVPLQSGEITDDARIRAALPTIRFLREHEARILLCSHLGRPGGEPQEALRLDPIAGRLSELLGAQVAKADDCIGPEVESAVQGLGPGDVLLLENTRFHPGEKENDPEFAAQLARPADLYVNDAFAAAHRVHASTAGVAGHLPAFAGLLMQEEVETLAGARDHPMRPYVVILGGAKIGDKISAIERFLEQADLLLVGGGIANTFLKTRGLEVGESLVDGASVPVANGLLGKAGDRIRMPKDVMIAQSLEAHAPHRAVSIHSVPADWRIVDLGPASIERYRDKLADAAMVVWNGPMGAYEWEPFDQGTLAMAGILADLTINAGATTIAGGGETGAAVRQAGLADPGHGLSHVSTGGGAFLAFMEGQQLPGITYLEAD